VIRLKEVVLIHDLKVSVACSPKHPAEQFRTNPEYLEHFFGAEHDRQFARFSSEMQAVLHVRALARRLEKELQPDKPYIVGRRGDIRVDHVQLVSAQVLGCGSIRKRPV